MSAGFLKRIGAYIIDFLIILLISNLLSSFLPNNNKIVKLTKEGNEIIDGYYKALIESSDNIEEYSTKLNNYNYELGKLSVYSNLITISLYFLYFIIFQSYNNGQTVGKRLFKIEIRSCNGKELNYKQLFIRGIILYPIIINLLNIIAIIVCKQSVYEDVSFVTTFIKYLLFLICFISIVINHRGIHDKLSGTVVIVSGSVKENEEDQMTKWKKVSEKEKKLSKYGNNHTSGRGKE